MIVSKSFSYFFVSVGLLCLSTSTFEVLFVVIEICLMDPAACDFSTVFFTVMVGIFSGRYTGDRSIYSFPSPYVLIALIRFCLI